MQRRREPRPLEVDGERSHGDARLERGEGREERRGEAEGLLRGVAEEVDPGSPEGAAGGVGPGHDAHVPVGEPELEGAEIHDGPGAGGAPPLPRSPASRLTAHESGAAHTTPGAGAPGKRPHRVRRRGGGAGLIEQRPVLLEPRRGHLGAPDARTTPAVETSQLARWPAGRRVSYASSSASLVAASTFASAA